MIPIHKRAVKVGWVDCHWLIATPDSGVKELMKCEKKDSILHKYQILSCPGVSTNIQGSKEWKANCR